MANQSIFTKEMGLFAIGFFAVILILAWGIIILSLGCYGYNCLGAALAFFWGAIPTSILGEISSIFVLIGSKQDNITRTKALFASIFFGLFILVFLFFLISGTSPI